MKKSVFVVVFALVAITSTYANNNERTIRSKSDYTYQNIMDPRAKYQPLIVTVNCNLEKSDPCTVSRTLVTKTTKTTISSTAGTCKEANAAVEKIVKSLT